MLRVFLVLIAVLSFLILDVLGKTFVDLLNPSFDATKMERLTALLAVPKSTPLVNDVLADNAFLSALRETFYEENALLAEILEATQKVFEVEFDFGLVSFVVSFASLVVLDFVLMLNLVIIQVTDKLCCGAQVFMIHFSLLIALALFSTLELIFAIFIWFQKHCIFFIKESCVLDHVQLILSMLPIEDIPRFEVPASTAAPTSTSAS